MRKVDVVKKIAEKTGVEKTAVLVTVEEFMSLVKSALASGENVYLRGFGTFEVKHRAEKAARNITKGNQIIVPEHDIPHFKPSKDFKASVK